MWHSIEKAITQSTGEKFTISEKQSISGGDINDAYKVSNKQERYFVKVNDAQHLKHFETEAYALAQIDNIHQINCPNVIAYGASGDKSYLILDFIPFDKATKTDWYCLGEQLASMHKKSVHGQFGWQSDNYIGDTLQPNNWSSNWRTFFSEQRIGWQLQLLQEKSIKLGSIEHIVESCHDALLHHNIKPRLVHGDLWQGNLGFTNNSAVIFDPACYYGDREVDIAMTELFGCLPKEFYLGYQAVFPLTHGYEQRKIIYNFYHILNHANLFGGVYIEQSKAVLSRIMSMNMQLH